MNVPLKPMLGSVGPELTRSCLPNVVPAMEVERYVLSSRFPGVSSRCWNSTCTTPFSATAIHGYTWSALERSLFTTIDRLQVAPPSVERLKRTSALPVRQPPQTTDTVPFGPTVIEG